MDAQSFAMFPHVAEDKLYLNAFFTDAAKEIGASSALVTDKNGRLFVLVHERGKPSSVRDLLTGNEIASFEVPPHATFLCPVGEPGLALYCDPMNHLEIRQIPSGKILGPLELSIGRGMISHDGKTTVQASAAITIVDRAEINESLKLPAMKNPFLSPDGRFLHGRISSHDPPPWLGRLMRWLGLAVETGGGIVLYDLTSEKEIAFFSSAEKAQFSANCQWVAVWSNNSIAFYDLPLRRPWAKIAAYSVSVAALVFLAGWVVGYFREKIAQKRRERLARLTAL